MQFLCPPTELRCTHIFNNPLFSPPFVPFVFFVVYLFKEPQRHKGHKEREEREERKKRDLCVHGSPTERAHGKGVKFLKDTQAYVVLHL
ncbi:hypothetical protein NIES4071_92300 [Calothrix sp. NIES-4071]|nr:hypothetical protein NIES4071_92300 [Calothrix sp. NIES-4071]BAZ63497.1 hypothetical protein NIES4105_92230 [Calothrix sp. NIES-4105]